MDLTESARPHAFSTLVATIVAPGEAFAAIEQRPSWGLALAVTVALAALGSFLGTPAARHMLEASIPAQIAADPRFAGLPPDQLSSRTQQLLGVALAFANVAWLFSIVYVPILTLAEAGVLFGASALARTRATFAQIFTLTTHVQFIAIGIGSLVLGAILALRPVDSFHSQLDLVSATPSLAWFASGGSSKALAFLAAIGPFQLWATILLALGLVAVARFRPVLAWSAAVLLLLLGAGIGAAFVR